MTNADLPFIDITRGARQSRLPRLRGPVGTEEDNSFRAKWWKRFERGGDREAAVFLRLLSFASAQGGETLLRAPNDDQFRY